ncbi:MAG: sulfotransferase domain-containing protein [Hyphomonadaceae bacterium]
MPELPVKTRDIHNHHMDSTIWDALTPRADDIIISTYGKSGTTWTQQIVGQLLFNGAADVLVHDLSPWVDLRVPPKAVKAPIIEAQTNRRFLKTHLPVDALTFWPQAKYIYIGRDGRDVMWSMHNHHVTANEAWYDALNNTPGRVGRPIDKPMQDVRAYFLEWLEKDGYPFWPFWENVRSWWAIRGLPNVLMVHFSDLKADMEGQIRRIAAFLDLDPPPSAWPAILEHCSFVYMKQNADRVAPLGGALWDGGGQSFINKGANGRWREMLTAEDNARYEARAMEELGGACAAWLKNGSLHAG